MKSNNETFALKLLERWAMRVLQRQNISIKSVNEINGFYIIKITESLISKTFPHSEIIEKNPKNDKEKLKLFGNAIDFISSQNVENLELPTAEDLLDKNTKVHQLLYDLFYHFELFGFYESSNAKESIEKWAKTELSEKIYKNVSFKISDESWRDGSAFCALIHKFYPQSVKYETIKQNNSEANIRLAIYASNVLLDFENLFNAKDLADIDEKGLLLLISEYYFAFKTIKSKIPTEKITNFCKCIQIFENNKNKYSKRIGEIFTILDHYNKKFSEENKTDDRLNFSELAKSNNCRVFSNNLENENLANFLMARKINSKNLMEDIIGDDSIKNVREKMDIYEKNVTRITNNAYEQNSSDNSLISKDKLHAKLLEDLKFWVNNIKTKFSINSYAKTMNEISDKISCHEALSLEILAKKGYFIGELQRLEEELEKCNYKNLKVVKNRLNYKSLFEKIHDEWCQKLLFLKNLREKIESDCKVKQFYDKYEEIVQNLKDRVNNHLTKICCDQEVNSLIEAKKLIFRTHFENVSVVEQNNLDLKQMENLRVKIFFIGRKSLSYVKNDLNYFKDHDIEIRKMDEELNSKYEMAMNQLYKISERESFKEKAFVLGELHKDESIQSLQIVEKMQQTISEISTQFESQDDIVEALSKIENCRDQIKYNINEKIEFLQRISQKVSDAVYENTEYPELYWKQDKKEFSEAEMRLLRDKIIVSTAKLSVICDSKEKEILKEKSKLEKAKKQRIRFGAMVDEFTEFISVSNEKLEKINLENAAGKENFSEWVEEQKSLYLNQANLLFNDIKKLPEESDIKSILTEDFDKLMSNLQKLFDDFKNTFEKSTLSAKSNKNNSQNNDIISKKYAKQQKKLVNALRKTADDFLKMNDFEKNSDQIEKEHDENISKLTEELKILTECELEINHHNIFQNPYTSLKYENVKKLHNIIVENLKKKREILKRIIAFEKLSTMPQQNLKSFHKKHSKHFDSKKNAYMNKEGFLASMKENGIEVQKNEVDTVFEKYSVQSKKSEQNLISFKKYNEFVNCVEYTHNLKNIRDSFKKINKGLPFITESQLDEKFSENICSYLKQKLDSENNEEKRYFFNEFIEEYF